MSTPPTLNILTWTHHGWTCDRTIGSTMPRLDGTCRSPVTTDQTSLEAPPFRSLARKTCRAVVSDTACSDARDGLCTATAAIEIEQRLPAGPVVKPSKRKQTSRGGDDHRVTTIGEPQAIEWHVRSVRSMRRTSTTAVPMNSKISTSQSS